MKARVLKQTIDLRARRVGKPWHLERRGGRHDLWRCGQTVVTIPRHREVNEITALGIMKALECELGMTWWRG